MDKPIQTSWRPLRIIGIFLILGYLEQPSDPKIVINALTTAVAELGLIIWLVVEIGRGIQARKKRREQEN